MWKLKKKFIWFKKVIKNYLKRNCKNSFVFNKRVEAALLNGKILNKIDIGCVYITVGVVLIFYKGACYAEKERDDYKIFLENIYVCLIPHE